MALTRFKILIGFLVLSLPTLAQADCFKTVREVRANKVKIRWQETTANDGKPMTISIANGAGGLVYSAQKAGQLWMSGDISVCRPFRRWHSGYPERHENDSKCSDDCKDGVSSYAVGPNCG